MLQVQQQLNIPADAVQLTDDFLKKSYSLTSILKAGHTINKPEVLFRNITNDDVEQLRDRCAVCLSCYKLVVLLIVMLSLQDIL